MANITYVASLVPDEPLDAPQPWQLRAAVRDAMSGLELELVQHQPGKTPAAQAQLQLVTLRVPDLDSAVGFFHGKLGMTLHRKYSLVPSEPAMSAWMGFGGGAAEGEEMREARTLVDLRYNYGKDFGRNRAKSPGRTATLTVSVSDVEAATAALLAPDREAALPAPKKDYVQTDLNDDGEAEPESACDLVVPQGAIPGIGDDAAVVKAAQPPTGLNIALVDELDFLKQTLL